MTNIPALDLDFTRSHFPAFFNQDGDAQDFCFFENAGGTAPCKPVISRLSEFYNHYKVQPYGLFPLSKIAGEKMDEAYPAMARYLNCPQEDISFGPSTSQNSYVLANALKAGLKAGDEIIFTNQDHEANGGVWRQLVLQGGEAMGIKAHEWCVNPQSGMLDPADLAGLLSPKTKLVTMPHCSNILGKINPIAKIASLVHAQGALLLVDGVSYAGHGFPDIKKLGCDIYLCSLYKIYGPHLGLMVINENARQRLEPQCHYFNRDDLHKAYVPAGPDHAQIGAVAGIASYFDALYAHHFPADYALTGLDANIVPAKVKTLLEAAERPLMEDMLDFLSQKKAVRVLGPLSPESRAPTFSFVHDEINNEYIILELAKAGIMARHGDFYSKRLVEALGIDPNQGVCRLSAVHYTSRQDIKRCIDSLHKIFTNHP